MDTLILFFIFVLNFGISWWNARAVGSGWLEARAAGGWVRLVAWSGAAMSAAGFTWCYLVVETILGSIITHTPKGSDVAVPYISPDMANAVFSLGYLMIVPVVLGSGVIITIHSWRVAIKEKRALGYGIAGYNTAADIYNAYQAFRNMPIAFDTVTEFFSAKSSKDGDKVKIVLLLVIIALFGGVLTTYYIAKGAMENEMMGQGLNQRRWRNA